MVDVALYEPLMFIIGDLVLRYTGLGEIQTRIGNDTGAASPRGIYQASDGRYLAIAASNQSIAARLFAAMGQPDLIRDPRFATNADRLANNELVQKQVADWVGSLPRDRVLAVLEEYEVVSSPVNDASDIVADPHFLERTLVPITGNETLRSVLMPGPVLHMAHYPGPEYHGVPAVGEHTHSVLSEEFRFSESELAGLVDGGVINAAR